MMEQITPKSFREKVKSEQDTVRSWVDKNYETIWKLSEEAKIVSDEPFRVDTAYGTVQFVPKIV